MSLEECFELYDAEFLKFDRIENKRSGRPDLHAFLLLDSLIPGTSDIVCATQHDEIFLDVDPIVLNEVISDDQLVELIRCGVRLDSESDSLAMFV